jgi:hypothetical protein
VVTYFTTYLLCILYDNVGMNDSADKAVCKRMRENVRKLTLVLGVLIHFSEPWRAEGGGF